MIVGFTGTRDGMAPAQVQGVLELLRRLAPTLAIHGDCIGADDLFDELCYNLKIDREIYPCTAGDDLRARGDLKRPKGVAKVHDLMKPLKRNEVIVRNCDVLIATPATSEEQVRGGTWFTIRYARKKKRNLYIVFPTGELGS